MRKRIALIAIVALMCCLMSGCIRVNIGFDMSGDDPSVSMEMLILEAYSGMLGTSDDIELETVTVDGARYVTLGSGTANIGEGGTLMGALTDSFVKSAETMANGDDIDDLDDFNAFFKSVSMVDTVHDDYTEHTFTLVMDTGEEEDDEQEIYTSEETYLGDYLYDNGHIHVPVSNTAIDYFDNPEGYVPVKGFDNEAAFNNYYFGSDIYLGVYGGLREDIDMGVRDGDFWYFGRLFHGDAFIEEWESYKYWEARETMQWVRAEEWFGDDREAWPPMRTESTEVSSGTIDIPGMSENSAQFVFTIKMPGNIVSTSHGEIEGSNTVRAALVGSELENNGIVELVVVSRSTSALSGGAGGGIDDNNSIGGVTETPVNSNASSGSAVMWWGITAGLFVVLILCVSAITKIIVNMQDR